MATRYAGTPLSSEWDSVQRRRAINKALIEQSLSGGRQGTEMVSGGPHGPTQAVPYSLGTGLEQIGKAIIARQSGKKLDQEEAALADKFDVNKQRAVDTFTGKLQGTPTPYNLSPDEQFAGEQIPGLQNAAQAPDRTGALMEGGSNPYLQTPGMQNVISALTAEKEEKRPTFKTEKKALPSGKFQDVAIRSGAPAEDWGAPYAAGPNASTTNVTQNVSNKGQTAFAKALGGEDAKTYIANRTSAQEAVSLLESQNEGLKLMDEGMISGAFANFEVGAAKILHKFGFNYKKNQVENAQAFSAAAAKRTASIIKQFGSGTGLSDADREYALKASGGDITMDANTLRKIFDINRRASLWAIKKHNERSAAVRKAHPDVIPWDDSITSPEPYQPESVGGLTSDEEAEFKALEAEFGAP